MVDPLLLQDFVRVLRQGLREDLSEGDVTCTCTVPRDHRSRAVLVARASGVASGLAAWTSIAPLLTEVHPSFDGLAFDVSPRVPESAAVRQGDVLLELTGHTHAILAAERTALNVHQRLAGVSTQTRALVEACAPAKLLDTRKTTPGWRSLERWAVRQGGGTNHRFGLGDMVLIKENHARAAGGVRPASLAALARRPEGMKVVCEVTTIAEMETLLDLPLDRVLLDNFRPDMVESARARRDTSDATWQIEVSGGITLANAVFYSRAGAEWISVGALTHSVPALDLSLLLEDAN